MSAATALSDEQIIEVQGELAAGRPVTVWFTDAAVGVPVGGSAKVLAIGDPAAGDFVQVRPTGSRDELFCSPSELTRNRPPRRKAAAAATAPPAVAEPAVPQPRSAATERPVQRAAKEKPQPAATAEVSAPSAPEKPRPAPRRAARETTGPELTVVLQPTSSGEWVASVTRGSKTVVRPTPVPPGDVAKAARCLPPAVGEAVDAALTAARTRQQERVASLQAELEAARQALEDLGG